MEPLRLYSFFNSSTSFRVRIALELKELPWQAVTVNLRQGEHRQPAFEGLNPAQQVPVLLHGDRRITQSLAIIDFLDQLAPRPRLLPEPGPLRTAVLEVAMAIATDMHQVNNMRTQQYLAQQLHMGTEQKAAWAAHWWRTGFAAVESLLPSGRGGWAIGDAPTLADCCLVPQVANALRGGFEVTAFPKLWRAYEQAMSHPAFQRAAPARQADYVAH